LETVIKISSATLEEMFVAYSLKNASFFLKIKPYLATNSYKKKCYFNDEKNQILFNLLARWYDKYTSFPTLKEVKLFIERINEDEDIKIYLYSLVDKYYNSNEYDGLNEKNLLEEAENYILQQRVIENIALSQIDIEKGSYSNIVERMREAVSVNFDKDLGVSIKDYQMIVEKINSSLKGQNVIKTGLTTLDRLINISGSEIFTVAAPPGIGKTFILGNFAINAFYQNKKVLVYSMETGTARLFTRYISNILKVSKNEIISETENVVTNKLKNRISDTPGDIILKEYGSNQVSSNDLMAHINDLVMYNNWKPDIVIVDYLLIMTTNDKKLSSENPFKYYKTVTEEVRNIAKLYNIPILTACQINREGQADGGGTKALLTGKNIAESRGILDTSDYFITLNQTAQEKKRNEMRLYIEKNRNGQTGDIIPCVVDYNFMEIKERIGERN
jgi:replicative DNA helicase